MLNPVEIEMDKPKLETERTRERKSLLALTLRN